MTNVAEFLLAVKYLERRVKDRDLTQSAVLFAWEHLDECRGNPRAWLLAIAWHVRRDGRKRLAREINVMDVYVREPRARFAEPEQEQAVLLREIAELPVAAPIFRDGGCMVARMRARERVQVAFA